MSKQYLVTCRCYNYATNQFYNISKYDILSQMVHIKKFESYIAFQNCCTLVYHKLMLHFIMQANEKPF